MKMSELRWGVLSTSSIARAQVVPAIQSSSAGRVTAVASRNLDRAREFADDFGIPNAYGDYEALLSDPDIDVVYIPLPNSMHEEWALRACERGLPTLCEKPLSTSPESAMKMIAAFEKKNVPLMEAFMYRFNPVHAKVRSLIEEGVIGEVREVRAHLSTLRTQREDPLGNIILNKELGGGVLFDAGCYPVNVTRLMFGDEPLRAIGWQKNYEKFEVDETTAAILEFSDGRLGIVSSSHRAGGISFYTVIGTHGTIEVPRGFLVGWGDVINEPLIVVTDGRTTARKEIITQPVNQYQLMVEGFADAVVNGKPVPLSPMDAVNNLKAITAIIRSAASGRIEDV